MTEREMRLGLYRKIEVARKQLPYMDETAFRNVLMTEYGVKSRKEMTVRQLSRLVQYFATLGAEYKAPAKSRNKRVTAASRPDFITIPDSDRYATSKRQILAIWRKLGYSMSSLDTRVKRAFNVQCFAWLDDWKNITTLLSDLQRREKAFDAKKAKQAANDNQGTQS